MVVRPGAPSSFLLLLVRHLLLVAMHLLLLNSYYIIDLRISCRKSTEPDLARQVPYLRLPLCLGYFSSEVLYALWPVAVSDGGERACVGGDCGECRTAPSPVHGGTPVLDRTYLGVACRSETTGMMWVCIPNTSSDCTYLH